MIRHPAALCLAVLAVAGIAPAMAQQNGAATVTTATSEEYETGYLATDDGRALYMFTRDDRGGADASPASNCREECLEAWPPLMTEGAPQAGEGVQADLLGTLQRPDGGTQVTYGGWPLYLYFRDQSDDFQTHGQSLQTHGGDRFLLHPDGEIIEERNF